ncbi:transcriptional regulator [Edaphobacter acidisoli]|uniref:Transcriptional regulator n=1 Tax=Edaphobacter acidisoli TaxID=2040573 RepID=A0A916RI33_9BACT|nr:GlxA family transcriptional regulator [Edaphobacter acidisoli]GGA56665.1 transcriptional regulator [Edaphobacter acidisoli]
MNRPNPKRRTTQRIDGPARSPGQSTRRVLIVAVPPVRTLDVFGPLEVFSDANRSRSEEPIYEVAVVSAGTDRDVLSHLGLPIHTDQTYGEYCGPIDTLLVAGYDGVSKVRYEPSFLKWLSESCASSRRFGSVCTGALVLAEAGLLDGRRATTHWNWCEELARDYPRVTVDPTPIFVRDGNCYTSAGVTAGIDLALALVEEDLGRQTALKVAQMMVVFLHRPGGQSQFSATLMAQSSEKRPLGDVLAWLPDNIQRNLSIEGLARRAAMSPRNFVRVFHLEVGKTPARYIEDLRIEAARRQIESTAMTLQEIALSCGFTSAETLRRAFARCLGVTPRQYRASFGRARVQ